MQDNNRFHLRSRRCLAAVAVTLLFPAAFGCGAQAQNSASPATITVDLKAARHPISPLIYGVAFAGPDQLKQLGFTINRMGGNGETRYNWKNNSYNSASDWYFESNPAKDLIPAGAIDSTVKDDRSVGVQTMVTLSTIGWVARVVDENTVLSSYPVSKYGPQQKTDPYRADAGNGVRPDGTKIEGANPADANVPSDVNFQKGLVEHLISTWGKSEARGVQFYIMDNEPSLWQETHRDVHPIGPTSQEVLDDIINYGTMVKSLDPGAQVVAPEEWGWPGYFDSGAGNQYSGAHNYTTDTPDRRARGGMDSLPWMLSKLKQHDAQTGKRTLDYFTVHIYPQGGDGGDDASEKTQLLRNRSTRALWDPDYVDESWIHKSIHLIPRLKEWVNTYYPGTKIGITEYNWGAEKTIGGATAQADILGIFGREGLDLATRWTTPDAATPTFKAMQMYRDYDGKGSAFGGSAVTESQSVSPDELSSFSAVRSTDGALTVMVVNKTPVAGTESRPLKIKVAGGAGLGIEAQVWQLTSTNSIDKLADVPVSTAGEIDTKVPAQSVTLFVVPGGSK